jgi:hypothetical protein
LPFRNHDLTYRSKETDMKPRKMWTTALTLVLALTCLSFKCGGDGSSDPKRKYAKAADDIAGAISAMIDAKRNLAQQNRISADEERNLTQLLTAANDADIAFTNRLKSTTTIDAASRADLTNLLSQVTSAISSLNDSGVLRLGNADARQRLSRFITTANAALAILAQLQTAPTPTP